MRDGGASADEGGFGVAYAGPTWQAYTEEAFWYFLAAERKRADRHGRPFLLVRVAPGAAARVDGAVAPRLFASLAHCLRESDFVGWYEAGRVAGAVLAEVGGGGRAEIERAVRERVVRALGGALPRDVARALEIHINQHPPPAPSGSCDPPVGELI